jgi:hypothetical protein
VTVAASGMPRALVPSKVNCATAASNLYPPSAANIVSAKRATIPPSVVAAPRLSISGSAVTAGQAVVVAIQPELRVVARALADLTDAWTRTTLSPTAHGGDREAAQRLTQQLAPGRCAPSVCAVEHVDRRHEPGRDEQPIALNGGVGVPGAVHGAQEQVPAFAGHENESFFSRSATAASTYASASPAALSRAPCV